MWPFRSADQAAETPEDRVQREHALREREERERREREGRDWEGIKDWRQLLAWIVTKTSRAGTLLMLIAGTLIILVAVLLVAAYCLARMGEAHAQTVVAMKLVAGVFASITSALVAYIVRAMKRR